MITIDPALIEHRANTVVSLTRAGYSATAIAAHLRVSERTVQRYRRATGIAQRRAPALTPDEIATARELLEDGASYTEVHRTIGRSVEAISRHFPGYGWTQSMAAEYRHARQALDALKGVSA